MKKLNRVLETLVLVGFAALILSGCGSSGDTVEYESAVEANRLCAAANQRALAVNQRSAGIANGRYNLVITAYCTNNVEIKGRVSISMNPEKR